MESQTLECSLPMPPGLECERCVARLQAELSRIQGVARAVVNHARATLLITYDARQCDARFLEVETRQIGAAIAAQTAHQTIELRDLHCPDCAKTVEKDIRRLSGVHWAEIQFAASQMRVEYDRSMTTLDAICHGVTAHGIGTCPIRLSDAGNADEANTVARPGSGHETARRKRMEAVIAALLTLLAVAPHSVTPLILDRWLYAAAIAIGGWQIAASAWTAAKARALDMNALVTLAVVGAAGTGEWFEGAIVVVLFNVGNLLQIGAMERTRRSIRALMRFGPKTARVEQDGGEIEMPVEQVERNAVVIVKPGERIPMDGEILSGATTINQSPITGESVPVSKGQGDSVFGGTLNGAGAITFRVTHRFQDTVLARIIHYVEEAQAQRAPVQAFIDRFASRYTPVVIALAAAIAVAPPVAQALWSGAHGIPFAPASWIPWLHRALAILLISCPCALVISTPVAIVTAIGSASRNGILVKGGAFLDIAANLRVLLYDKTGTLTRGQCRVQEVACLGKPSRSEILEIALALEAKSEHPLASAFAHAMHEQSDVRRYEVTDFRAIPGGGVFGVIEEIGRAHV